MRIEFARGAETATRGMSIRRTWQTVNRRHRCIELRGGRHPAALACSHARHALREYTRRCRTASASTSSTGSVCDQLRHASVIDTPYCNGTPGCRS
ncbi:hypothetical protein BamMEX5DRAFT_5513 [Burkholderia ambifaria MEX-5]|uniref:Uncharacterized protein n=1 Tax=Burkholderia ambifaria MEX-5 TaxID=396597 RepID=B1TCJ7_9BURK|nr:hypothetical protein BamMEX5DRAFT_5513 [Burkholderia ambifaria MEX-5]